MTGQIDKQAIKQGLKEISEGKVVPLSQLEEGLALNTVREKMERGIGKCPHGEFDLRKGCPLCIADREEREGNTEASIAEAVKAAQKVPVKIKVTIPEEATEEEVVKVVEEVTNLVNVLEEIRQETAVALRPGEDIEAHGYFEESLRILEYAKGRVITTLEQAQSATDDLAVISRLTKAMTDKRKALLAPLEAKKVEIRDTYDYLMLPIQEANKVTRSKMLGYDMEQRRIQLEQEEINRKRLEAAEAEMRLKGEITESVNLVEVTEAPERVRTDMGLSTTTDRWKYRVDNPDLLPREYMMPDDAMLSSIAKKHHDKKPVPGVTFYNDPFITVRTK